MFVLITFILLFLSIAAVVGLRLARRGGSHTWLITVAVLLTWVSVLLWQFDLPWRFTPGQWMSTGLFNTSPQFFATPIAWIYALALTALMAAVILTSPARSGQVGTASWPSTLALTGLGLLTVLADNPLGLALAWTALDLTEFLLVMRKSIATGERIWLSFIIRLIATAFALWASVVGTAASGLTFSLENTPAQAGIFLVIAAGLRLAAIPFNIARPADGLTVRRGFETSLWMVSALTGLLVLARIPASAIDPDWVLPLLIVLACVALFSGWKWLFAADELQGQPYWLLGLSALSFAACLGNNPAGAAAWGVMLILFGGISLLYSARQVWLTRIFAVASLFLMALPFTLTATGWDGVFPLPFVFLPLFVIAHAMLVAGYLRHLFRPAETDFAQLPNWSQTTYSLGMGLLVLISLLGSLWGWSGALQLGNWIISPIVLLLTGVALFVSFRLPQLTLFKPLKIRVRKNRPVPFPALLNIFVRIFSFFYQLLGNLVIYISDLLEGDGGLLWTLLLLILLIAFLRGR